MGAGHSSLKNDVVRSESAELYVIRTSLHSSLGAVLLEAVLYRTPHGGYLTATFGYSN